MVSSVLRANATGSAVTILGVDDDPRILDIVRHFLELEGYTVKVASDGNAGFEVASHGGVELIPLDMRMPDPDGISTWGHKVRYEFTSSRTGQKRREAIICDGSRTRWTGFAGRAREHFPTLADDVRSDITRHGIRRAIYRASGALDASQDGAPAQVTRFQSDGADPVRV